MSGAASVDPKSPTGAIDAAPILCVALNPTVDVSCAAARVVPIHKVRTHAQRQHPGGGGVNVARAIAELGGRAHLVYLSGGATGALLDDLISDPRIERSRVPIAGSVRMAFNVHEDDTGLEYRFVPEGPTILPEELEAVRRIVEESGCSIVVASGSLPLGVPADTYAEMARSVAARAGRFVLDAAGPALRAAAKGGHVFLAKPSLGELEGLLGRRVGAAGAAEAAAALVREGAARHVAVTLGREGAVLAGPSGTHRLPALPVPVHSAVGAGDCFLAGMVWALAAGARMEEAFGWGVAAGAAAVKAEAGVLCRRDDALALHARIGAASADAQP